MSGWEMARENKDRAHTKREQDNIDTTIHGERYVSHTPCKIDQESRKKFNLVTSLAERLVTAGRADMEMYRIMSMKSVFLSESMVMKCNKTLSMPALYTYHVYIWRES